MTSAIRKSLKDKEAAVISMYGVEMQDLTKRDTEPKKVICSIEDMLASLKKNPLYSLEYAKEQAAKLDRDLEFSVARFIQEIVWKKENLPEWCSLLRCAERTLSLQEVLSTLYDDKAIIMACRVIALAHKVWDWEKNQENLASDLAGYRASMWFLDTSYTLTLSRYGVKDFWHSAKLQKIARCR